MRAARPAPDSILLIRSGKLCLWTVPYLNCL